MKAIILHGTQGSPEGNWFRWLEAELTAKGWDVWLPSLPHAEKPSLKEWSDFVLTETPFVIDEDTVLIGHSSGSIAVTIVAQRLDRPVRATFVVSFFKDNEFLQWDACDALFDMPFDFEAIARNAGTLVIIHSDDDPYCPMDHPELLASKTGGELIVIPGQGHFNLEKSPSYRAFPKLLALIDEKVQA